MQLTFYGGAQEVGRSAIFMKDDRGIMMDYGVKLGDNPEYPIGMPEIDLLLISHAHLDHSGYAPAIYAEMEVPAYGTPPTYELSDLLLEDSIRVAKKQHKRQPFSKRNIKMFEKNFTNIDYGKALHFGNYDISLHDAGHIAGSSIISIERAKAKDYRRVVYTGDFKLHPQMLHSGAEVVESDVLIMESTYATKDHPDRDRLGRAFIEEVKGTLDANGTVLLPTFAVGRSQEILMLLHKAGLADRVYIDGMVKDATAIALRHPNYLKDAAGLARAAKEATWIGDYNDREAVLNGPSIILTTSGMLNGGPVMDYIKRLDRNSHVILNGYQQEGTNGRMLLETGMVVLNGRHIKVNAKVSFYDFSAHAGKEDLFDYVRKSSPTDVVCVHGDRENAQSLADSLELEGFNAYAPKLGETITFKG